MIATLPLQQIHKHQETLHQEDFEALFGEAPGTLFQECQELVGRHDLRYDTLQGASRDQVLLRVLKTLDQDLEVAGTHRRQRWEDGKPPAQKVPRSPGFPASRHPGRQV